MTEPRKRLSVSAIRDYNRCSRYYFYKRVMKYPDPMSHHAPAGTLVHNAFYAAYGTPTLQIDMSTGRMKTQWFVHGKFEPEMAKAVFDLFWAQAAKGSLFEGLLRHVKNKDFHEGPLRDELETYFHALKGEMPIVNNFCAGQLKALGKGQKLTQTQLKDGWGAYYREMLELITEKPLPLPVKEIEREVVWKQGDVDMLGYIDIVLDAGGGAEEGYDLKSAFNKPSDKELVLEDQMLGYYEASEYHGVNMQAFYFWHLRSDTKYLVKDNAKTRALLRASAQHVSNKIQAEDWSPRFDKENCSYCTYLNDCLKAPHIGVGPFDALSELPLTPIPPSQNHVPTVFF